MIETAVLIRLHAKPEHIDAVRAQTEQLLSAVRAEPGCQDLQLLQKQEDPAQFVILETWSDRDYYLSDAHQQSAHMLAYFDATKSMLADVGVELWSPLAPPSESLAHDAA